MCPSGRLCASVSSVSTTLCLKNQANCADDSDLDPEFCRSYECGVGYVHCHSDPYCIPKAKLCDGVYDCDGESELIRAVRTASAAHRELVSGSARLAP